MKVTHGGGPFDLPTDIAFAPSGEMFMTDAHGNTRNSRPTESISWGEPGNAPRTIQSPTRRMGSKKKTLLSPSATKISSGAIPP